MAVAVPETAARVSVSSANRFAWGDYVRVFGTVAVIAQHAAHRTTLFGDPNIHSATWWGILSIEAACRWAVPLFVMLSGALLLDPQRRESPTEFYRKRFWRIGIPLVFWSLFYLLPGIAADGLSSSKLAEVGTKLAHGRPAYHMYFLFIIAGLYLLTPYLRIVVHELSGAQLRRLWIALLVLAWGAATLNIVYGYSQTILTEFVPYLGYYLAGYELRQQRLSKRGMWFVGAVVVLCVSVMVVVTAPLVERYGITVPARYLYDYFSPTVIATGIALFLISINTFDRVRDGAFARWITIVSPATLGIFLMHPALYMAIQEGQKRGFVREWDWTVTSTLLATLIAFLVCWAATAVCQRIPLLRTVVG
jgi:surface polysaccharide O-acyltransferase-like enzyme